MLAEWLNRFKKNHTPAGLEAAWAQAIAASTRLQHLVNNQESGWKEFCILVNELLKEGRKIRGSIRLDNAATDDKTILFLRLLDREIATLEKILTIPQRFIGGLEESLKDEQQRQEVENEGR
jgi:uncharacterized protein YeaO (DUF488 family)